VLLGLRGRNRQGKVEMRGPLRALSHRGTNWSAWPGIPVNDVPAMLGDVVEDGPGRWAMANAAENGRGQLVELARGRVTDPRGPDDSKRRKARGRVTDARARHVTDRDNDVSAGKKTGG
jgi:hypothetical protein